MSVDHRTFGKNRPQRSPSGVCVQCQVQYERLELDHITPLCAGGEHDTANLQWLCNACHRAKTTKDHKVCRRIAKKHQRDTFRILKQMQAQNP